MKKLILPILILLSVNANASQITFPYTYSPNDTVTNVKLNGNNTAISSVVNGALDNTNANTTSGYRFYQTVATLPSSGNQGAVYFLTSDDSLNFDTGAAFTKSVSVASPVQGDLVYYGASGWVALAPSTAGYLLQTNGASANPSWVASPLTSGGTFTGPVTFASTVTVQNGITGTIQGINITSIVGPLVLTYAANTPYLAATDGFVTATGLCKGNATDGFGIFSDSLATPTTQLTNCSSGSSTTSLNLSQSALIGKGDHWEAKNTAGSNGINITWKSIGS